MTSKKKKKKSAKGGKILFIIIGAVLILVSLYSVSLYLFGEETAAYDITSSRKRTYSDGDKEYYISYSYTEDGKEYNGSSTVHVDSSQINPSYDRTVHYFPFAPGFSSMYAEDSLSFGTCIIALLGVGIILFVTLPKKKKKTVRRVSAKKAETTVEEVDWESETPITMAWLMEHTTGYDDNLEKYYQNGWDKNDPSWQCDCKKWNTGDFCEKCGKSRK